VASVSPVRDFFQVVGIVAAGSEPNFTIDLDISSDVSIFHVRLSSHVYVFVRVDVSGSVQTESASSIQEVQIPCAIFPEARDVVVLVRLQVVIHVVVVFFQADVGVRPLVKRVKPPSVFGPFSSRITDVQVPVGLEVSGSVDAFTDAQISLVTGVAVACEIVLLHTGALAALRTFATRVPHDPELFVWIVIDREI